MFTAINPLCDAVASNDYFIKYHNDMNLSYQVGHNQFSERVYVNGKRPNMGYKRRSSKQYIEEDDSKGELPKHVDWRKKDVVSTVKNQLQCGSCWAFSATGAVESAWAIDRHKLYNLSQQELVDCSDGYGNMGCMGGDMDAAFQYVIDNGICTNKSYPYTGNDGQCMNMTCDKVIHIDNFTDVEPNDEHKLARAVKKRPVAVAIQANLQSFQLYKSGIYNDPDCGDELDHGVLVVGYGYDEWLNMSYWIVKNSWGSTWGDNGYIRIQKDIDNPEGMCGIAMDPSYPIIARINH